MNPGELPKTLRWHRDVVGTRIAGDTFVASLGGTLLKLKGSAEHAFWLVRPSISYDTYLREMADRGYSSNKSLEAARRLIQLSVFATEGQIAGRALQTDIREPRRLTPLWRQAGSTRTPLKVDIELTHRCNLACEYCYVQGLGIHEHLSTSRLFSLIDELSSQGTLFLTLTGGEPFFRKDLVSMAQKASEQGMIVTILTNGTLIEEHDAKALAEVPRVFVEVSLHGSNPEIHDGFTRVQGSFDKTLCSLRLLVEAGVTTYAKFTITRRNFFDRHNVPHLLETLGVPYRQYAETLPLLGGGSPSRWRLTGPDILTLCDEGIVRPRPRECLAGTAKAWIGPHGEVYPCELFRIPLGNVRTDTFREVWWSSSAEVFLSELPDMTNPVHCLSCGHRGWCPRCPAFAHLEDGNAYGPSSEGCRIAGIASGQSVRQAAGGISVGGGDQGG